MGAKVYPLVLFALLGAILLAGAALFIVEFDSPELGRAFLGKASQATGVRLSAGRFRLNLLRGLALEKVELESEMPGGRLSARIDRLVLNHRLLPLIFGKLSVTRLTLERPEVDLIETRQAKRAGEPAARASGPLKDQDSAGSNLPSKPPRREPVAQGGMSLEISEIRLEEGSLLARAEGQRNPSSGIEGLHLRLSNLSFNPKALSPVHGLSAEGDFSTKEIQIGTSRVREGRGQLKLAGGRFRAEDITFNTDQGQFRAELSVDFNRSPFVYSLVLEGNPLDTDAVLGAGDSKGGYGPGQLDFKADGLGSDSRNIKGQGVLKLAPGRLPANAVLSAVEKSLGRTSLVGARYKATEAPFRVERNRVLLEQFRLDTDQAALELSGWAELDGPLSLALLVLTPRQGLKIKEVPAELLDALTDEKGWVRIPFKVTGTPGKPGVTLDSSALLARARSGSEKVIKEKAAEKLKGFLRKKSF